MGEVHLTPREQELLDALADQNERVACLEADNERLQVQLRTMTGNRDRGLKVHRDTLAKWADTAAENEQLRDGIRQHRDTSPGPASDQDVALWALLDE